MSKKLSTAMEISEEGVSSVEKGRLYVYTSKVDEKERIEVDS